MKALQERAKATRASIIAGAALIFDEHGYGGTSLAQVAEASGVTKGALYFHFPSKDDLAAAIVAEQNRVVWESSEKIFAEGHSMLGTMILATQSFGLNLVHLPVVRAGVRLTTESTAYGTRVVEPYQDWISTMADLTARARDRGEVSQSVDPEAFGRYLVSSLSGVQMLSNLLTSRADVMQRICDMWAILLPGVLADPSEENVQALLSVTSPVVNAHPG